jgi:hypothetical protein
MSVKIEKTIYVRDKHRVKRQAFLAGQEIELQEYYAVLSSNAVVNPEDLPIVPKKQQPRSLAVETKDLTLESSVEVVKSEPDVVTPAPKVEVEKEEKVAVVKKPKKEESTED